MTTDEIKMAILAPYGGLRGLCERMEAVLSHAERPRNFEASADGKFIKIPKLEPYSNQKVD